MTRFLCTGDLHLGQGVERYGPERLADQADVWRRICEVAISEGVDGLLFAGDAFEGPLPTPEQYVAFTEPLRMLADADIPVVAICGNGKHDSAMRARNALEVIGVPGLHVSTRPEVVDVAGVAVCTLPWTPISRLVASRNGGDRDVLYREAAALLLQAVRGLRADVDDERPAVLLLHWSLSGAVTPTGREVGPDFGVVLDTAELEAAGFDAVIAGHIHQPQFYLDDSATPSVILHTDPGVPPMTNAWGWYVGSPLPLNFGEARCTHGVWIAEVGTATKAQFVPIESRPFVTIDLDFTAEAAADVTHAFHADFGIRLGERHGVADAVARVRYRATEEQQRRLDATVIRQALLDAGAWRVSIEPEIVREDRARVKVETKSLSELDALQLWLDANSVNGDRGAAMAERTTRYLQETT